MAQGDMDTASFLDALYELERDAIAGIIHKDFAANSAKDCCLQKNTEENR